MLVQANKQDEKLKIKLYKQKRMRLNRNQLLGDLISKTQGWLQRR